MQNATRVDDMRLPNRHAGSKPRPLFVPRVWHLLIPIGLFFSVVYLIPLFNIVIMSLEGGRFFGQKYWELVSDDIAMLVLWRTIWIAFTTAVLCLIIGYPIAYLLYLAPAGWQRLLMFLVLLPLWTSVLVRTFSWIVLLGRDGLVNRMLMGLGITEQPLLLLYSRLGTLIGLVQIMLPYMILPVFASMTKFERRFSQAAGVLGAGPFADFLLVFIPLSLNGVFAGFLIVFVVSLGLFVTPALLGGVQDTTFVMLIYKNINDLDDWNMAAAMAIVLLVATLTLSLTYRLVLAGQTPTGAAPNKWRILIFHFFVSIARMLQSVSKLRYRGERQAASFAGSHGGLRSIAAVGAIFLVISILPMIVLVPLSLSDAAFIAFPPPAYSLRWYANFFSRRDWYTPAIRSLFIAFSVMGISSVLGVCAAISAARLKKGAAAVYGLFLSPMMVPTVVFGLALYLILAKLGLIGTYLGLILGHTVLATPYVLVIMNSALANIDPSLENAAQILGAGPARAFMKTTLPLISPAIFSAALFAFLTSFDDIIIALFISDPRTTTLPKRMWEGIRFEIDPTSVAVSVILVMGSLVAVGAAELVRSRAHHFQMSSRAAIVHVE
jgi:putative spermidine/putrescine transport system permease protein